MEKPRGRRLTPEQAAEIVGVEPSTLANWRSNKRHILPYYKPGKRVYYWEKDIQEFIENNMK
jgi:predicted site-specific integrase-resolvase